MYQNATWSLRACLASMPRKYLRPLNQKLRGHLGREWHLPGAKSRPQGPQKLVFKSVGSVLWAPISYHMVYRLACIGVQIRGPYENACIISRRLGSRPSRWRPGPPSAAKYRTGLCSIASASHPLWGGLRRGRLHATHHHLEDSTLDVHAGGLQHKHVKMFRDACVQGLQGCVHAMMQPSS